MIIFVRQTPFMQGSQFVSILKPKKEKYLWRYFEIAEILECVGLIVKQCSYFKRREGNLDSLIA